MGDLRLTSAALLGALLALVVPGCGQETKATPLACLGQSGAYLSALRTAPGAVKLKGGAPLSSCLPAGQPEGDLATVGMAMIGAATRLNAEARVDPGGAANLRLGYLLGAAQRGAASTGGIHVELLRRLAVAARYSRPARPLPAVFFRTYRRGYRAGRRRG